MCSGVLKTEIDPVNPKVTVFGNVEPQVLIKKLAKVGKQAELRSCTSGSGSMDDQKDRKDKKERELNTREGTNTKPEKCPDSSNQEKIINIKETTPGKSDEKDPKKNQESINSGKSCAGEAVKSEGFCPPNPEVKYAVYPNMFPVTAGIRTAEQPYPIGMPYYTVCSYIAPLPPQAAFGQDFLAYGGQQVAAQPMFEAPVTRVGDYFSDENTVGCHVM